MLWMLSLALAGPAAELRPMATGHGAVDALIVPTPGVAVEAYLPLVDVLRREGRDVYLADWDCGAWTGADLRAALVDLQQSLRADYELVAHGVGATLAAQVSPDLAAARQIWIAPVLASVPVQLTEDAAALPVGAAVDLSRPWSWGGRSGQRVLLGELALDCAPAPFVREVQGWVASGPALRLDEVPQPVWISVSAGDDLAALEAVVPASRALSQRRLDRLGLNHFQAQDFDHGALLTDWRALKSVRRAVRRRRWSRPSALKER